MYLIVSRIQKCRKLFVVNWLLLGLGLNGCQTLPNYHAKPLSDSVITHKFLLADNQDIVGNIASIQIQRNDTLPDIARHFGLGFNDISIANPQLDPWLPEPGSKVILPIRYILPNAKRQGIVLNLASMRLFHFPKQRPKHVITYPIGIGRKGWSTPTGLTKIVAKKKNPVWRVPASIRKEHAQKGDPLPRIVPAGADNPLGDYAMRLAIPSYLIHGTNKPYGVGMQISHGCVRLYPEDIAALFQQTSVGTKVRIIDQPYLLGWEKDRLFLEAHQPLKQKKTFKNKLNKQLKKIERQAEFVIDWKQVETIIQQADGIPMPILLESSSVNSLENRMIQVAHPQYFKLQPEVKPITRQDWSITVTKFSDANTAQKLVALLNHQGPPIPARTVQKNGLSHVVVGPFQNSEEVQFVMRKIKREFQFDGIAHPPQAKENSQHSLWLFGE